MNPINRRDAALWVSLLAFAVLWLLLVQHLAVHWSVNPQYSFGWLVPFLVAYLLHQRWLDRPEAGGASRVVAVFAAVIAFGLLPTWLIEQPNPDWRLVSWLFSVEVVLLTLCAAHGIGGWPWVKHFAFPVCFIFTAIPWPTDLELLVIQGLTGWVAAATVETLNLCNIPALQHGNVIEIASGLLGIDEACSGVRSFQSTLMASLFLGEMYRFGAGRRALLVLAGSLLALICNIARAFFLGWKAGLEGSDAVEKYHDPAGFAILTVCFLLVWGLALLLSPNKPLPPLSQAAPRPVPFKLAWALAVWLALVIGATELWYRSHESAGKIRWDFAWPADQPGFKELPIAGKTSELLQFNEGRAASWKYGHREWTAFFFKWNAGPARSRILARTHRPDICLPASGIALERDLGTITLTAAGLSIPFRTFTFSARGTPMHVFFCVWQDRAKNSDAHDQRTGWDRATGFDSVLRGERNLGQQILELVLVGYTTDAEAEAALRAELPNLIKG